MTTYEQQWGAPAPQSQPPVAQAEDDWYAKHPNVTRFEECPKCKFMVEITKNGTRRCLNFRNCGHTWREGE